VLSAGVLMLVCGHKRLVTESCILMSHEGTASTMEDLKFSALKDRIKMEEWAQKHWCTLMARYTPFDAQFWKRTSIQKEEYWKLGGEDIVVNGLADAVYTKADT
jgi:hypothetical protein